LVSESSPCPGSGLINPPGFFSADPGDLASLRPCVLASNRACTQSGTIRWQPTCKSTFTVLKRHRHTSYDIRCLLAAGRSAASATRVPPQRIALVDSD
ncbi:hypothetical protein, partial [Accumulibacter sp.]|uniref:hypothetical protein n=1 Tax=Accumulibacter sp. TaxID=2053492 RepID=UPI002D07CD7D